MGDRDHPTTGELEGLLHGRLSREQTRGVVRHLLTGCAVCRAAIATHAHLLFPRAPAVPHIPPPSQFQQPRWRERPRRSFDARVRPHGSDSPRQADMLPAPVPAVPLAPLAATAPPAPSAPPA